jgi:hypothetical protein
MLLPPKDLGAPREALAFSCERIVSRLARFLVIVPISFHAFDALLHIPDTPAPCA